MTPDHLDFETPKVKGHATKQHVLNNNKYFDDGNENDTCISRRGVSDDMKKSD